MFSSKRSDEPQLTLFGVDKRRNFLHSPCRACGGAPTSWLIPQPQITLSLLTEAFQAASLSLVISGPYRNAVGKTQQSAIDDRIHVGRTAHRVTTNANQDLSLQEMEWPLPSNGDTSQEGRNTSIK